jgi:AraC-like DNA-binding protein
LCGSAVAVGRNAQGHVRMGSGASGIERLEAHFDGQAFSPHRHDTYAIGITLTGVQCFRYRGERRQCLPGQAHILHPDEIHDGGAGSDAGFGYRITYVDPSLVQQALGGRPLPFVADPVIDAAHLPAGLVAALQDIDEEIDELGGADIAVSVADMVMTRSGGTRNGGSLDLAALSRVRELIGREPARAHALAELECVTNLDRWTLARQFRAAFGTSPVRFRTMRRLDQVRRLLSGGVGAAEAAIVAGFADQSHMSRHFKRAYGVTPMRWVAMSA